MEGDDGGRERVGDGGIWWEVVGMVGDGERGWEIVGEGGRLWDVLGCCGMWWEMVGCGGRWLGMVGRVRASWMWWDVVGCFLEMVGDGERGWEKVGES